MVIAIVLLVLAAVFLFLAARKDPLWAAVFCLFVERLWSLRALLVGLCLVVALPLAAQAQVLARDESSHDSTRLHWAFACSVAADIGDTASTIYARRQRDDLQEGNTWFYGEDPSDARLILTKAIGSGIGHGLILWLHDDSDTAAKWSEIALWANCGWKGFNTGRNIWLARQDPTARASFALKVSF